MSSHSEGKALIAIVGLVAGLLLFRCDVKAEVFADGFERNVRVLVAQSAWDGTPTWQSIANTQDWTGPPSNTTIPYTMVIGTRPPPGMPTRPLWDAMAREAEAVFWKDEFDQRGYRPYELEKLDTLPEGVTAICNAACGTYPRRTQGQTEDDLPDWPTRCDVRACTPQYDSPTILVNYEALLDRGPIMIWVDAYLPYEWGTCTSYRCTRAADDWKLAKFNELWERYGNDPRVWGWSVFIGRKPANTPNDSRDLPHFPKLRARLEAVFGNG